MSTSKSSLLAKVEKPLRYINHELNAYHKSFDNAKARFCFIYPDIYEIGISHLGLKILYTIVNNYPDSIADRAYTPWFDLGDGLLKENLPLSALESKKSLKDFDCLGFTLATELTYTNILYTLDLAQIPLRSTDRNNEHPIIIAGGINAVNPHPLSLFIDAFFLGEAEEGFLKVIDIFIKEKDRIKRLKMLAELDFMYVSSEQKGKNKTITKKALKYQTFSSSRNTHYPQLVPLLDVTHNRYTSEIMRGCTRGCRFCQAGMFYRPVREKDPEIVLEQLLTDTKNSGWNSCGLLSLSSSDYTHIKPLIKELTTNLQGSGISISMPSLRMDSIDSNITEMLNHLKKSGITLAPEAGTQRLRDIINKNLTEEEILESAKFTYEAGAKLIKLYFMIGLPFETEDDIDGIILLIEKILEKTKRKMRINISLSPFVPKPMTPFQWAKIENKDILLSKALKIKHALIKYKFIKISYHTIELSLLEAVLCRGDRDTGYVIENAYLNGAKFDSWKEFFDFNIWLKAAKNVDYDWNKAVNGFAIEEPLPWDNIDIGISKDFLINEFKKAEKGCKTPDCRNDECCNCGVCFSIISERLVTTKNLVREAIQDTIKKITEQQLTEKKKSSYVNNQNIQYLYRVYYSKINDLKYLSHLDFLRLIHRLLMLSGLPISFSQGFNPHPRTSFCPPLSSGVEGEKEFFDFWTDNISSEKEIIASLSKTKINDLIFYTTDLLFDKNKYKSKYIPISDFDIEFLEVEFFIDKSKSDEYIRKYNAYVLSNDTIITKERKGIEKQFDLKNIIRDIDFNGKDLFIEKTIQGASVFDILKKIFDIDRDYVDNVKIIRKKMENLHHYIMEN
ncbi:MAG: TIGR03960 family B12-binding radical SAM protein [Candidatus Cloacimonetes bacterium]|nr:TIGR03960 family B12-binding radical SAM protein [Candidatus Cloacimonadota bacterium]